jgi:hypothetical protein
MADTEIFEDTKAKPKKRTRAPLSDAQKQVLRERLKKAREAKKNKQAEPKEQKPKKQSKPKEETVAIATEEKFNKETKRIEEVPKPAEPIDIPKQKPKDKPVSNYRKRQAEIEALREELEIQKLKNDLEDLKRRKPKLETIDEEKESKVETTGSVKREEAVKPSSDVPIPEPPKPIRHSLIPKNIWASF